MLLFGCYYCFREVPVTIHSIIIQIGSATTVSEAQGAFSDERRSGGRAAAEPTHRHARDRIETLTKNLYSDVLMHARG